MIELGDYIKPEKQKKFRRLAAEKRFKRLIKLENKVKNEVLR